MRFPVIMLIVAIMLVVGCSKEQAAVSPPPESMRQAEVETVQPVTPKSEPPEKRVLRMQTEAEAFRAPKAAPAPAYHSPRRPSPHVVAPNTEEYESLPETGFRFPQKDPLSTFSIDVDTASYANARRFLNNGQLPPPASVRVEEFINYFEYAYPVPDAGHPFSVHTQYGPCPWSETNRLLRIGVKGYEVTRDELPAGNYIFLLDVSGSMSQPNKLPLLKQSMKLFLSRLRPEDGVAIVTYAGSSGLAMPFTACSKANKAEIIASLDRLHAGGSTAGGAGLQLAYSVAEEHFIEDGINRVILATDGDFNVGVRGEPLNELITEKAKNGVFLTVLGFGMGNYKDASMEKLAKAGNGNYAYVDTFREAKKALVDQMSATVMTIASDVKIQVEFNPGAVQAYRLVGYENRRLADEDFNDDTKDAGEIGAGHTVTALYEIVPVGASLSGPLVDPLKFQSVEKPAVEHPNTGDLCWLKLRYKAPGEHASTRMDFIIKAEVLPLSSTDTDFRFASAAAMFGMLLSDSPFKGPAGYTDLLALAKDAMGEDEAGYRQEFVQIVETAGLLKNEL